MPLLEQFIGETDDRARLRGRGRATRSCSPARPPTTGATRSSTRTRRRPCATRAARPAGRKASSTRTARRSCTRSASRPARRSTCRFGEADTFLPVVPMFHANAWGYPYLAASLGAKIVYPGPLLDPHSLLEAFEQEQVTWAAGVPTIWMGILNVLDAEPGRYDLSHMKGMLVGGSAAPRAMIAAFKQRHGLDICHGWGMTETSPVASSPTSPATSRDADEETKFDYVALQGIPLPFVEVRARDVDGQLIPWDGEAMGELECRGPWMAASYYDTPEQADRWTDRRLVLHRRHRLDRRARLHRDQGPLEGRDQVGRRVDLLRRARVRAHGASGRGRGGGDRDPGREVDRTAARGRRAQAGRAGDGRGAPRVPRQAASRSGGCRTGSSSSTRSRRRPSASSARRRCASSLSGPSRRRQQRPSKSSSFSPGPATRSIHGRSGQPPCPVGTRLAPLSRAFARHKRVDRDCPHDMAARDAAGRGYEKR